jgi:hypothetical protein
MKQIVIMLSLYEPLTCIVHVASLHGVKLKFYTIAIFVILRDATNEDTEVSKATKAAAKAKAELLHLVMRSQGETHTHTHANQHSRFSTQMSHTHLLLNTFYTPSTHIPHTFYTPSTHIPHTFYTPSSRE